jgi:glycosyltransferase involved in cell wall biosynthesis
VSKFSHGRENFEYLGYVPDNELVRLYGMSNLFVMPSRSETFGLVALEAMACGTPLVVSDISGPRTLVTGEFGRLIPSGDAHELAKTIDWFFEKWLSDPEDLKQMGRRARKCAVEEHDWEVKAHLLGEMIRYTVSEST